MDTNNDLTLSDLEITDQSTVCNGQVGDPGNDGADGVSALFLISAEGEGQNCASGGYKVDTGHDIDESNTLDALEVTNTEYVCHGSHTIGVTSLVDKIPEPAGSNCTYGGAKLISGLDSNHDESLADDEIMFTHFICDGSNGADGLNSIVDITTEPSGDNCATGGQKIVTGLDASGDAILQAIEVSVRMVRMVRMVQMVIPVPMQMSYWEQYL